MPMRDRPESGQDPCGTPSSRSATEYRELRATIRERGSLRHLVVLITFSVWAATMLVGRERHWSVPIFILIPLVVLVAGFEVGFALHVGVERIGRYLQVRYEAGNGDACRAGSEPRWPSASRAGGVDPLFLRVFLAAAVLNLARRSVDVGAQPRSPWMNSAPIRPKLVVFGLVLHAAVAVRWIRAARFARSQRARELAAFENLLR